MTDKSNDHHPSIQWNGKAFKARLPVAELPKGVPGQKGFVLDCELEPALVYLVRIRKSKDGEWSPGFITPFTTQQFDYLEANTEYEIEVVPRGKHGDGPPQTIKAKTNPHGSLSNVIPFPRKR